MKKYLGSILIAIVAIVLIVLLIVFMVKLVSNSHANNQTVGTVGVVTLDGNSVGVFSSKEEAENNKFTVDAGMRSMKVSGFGNTSVHATVGGIPANIVTNAKGSTYDLDLNGIGNETTVMIQISVGGDGSLMGERLSGDVDKYFLAINVNNPDNVADTAKTLGLPNGKIFFGDDSYQTYGSETEAQQAVSNNPLVLPTYVVENGIQLRAEPNENTARIQVKACMLDGDPINRDGPRLYSGNGWSDVLDVSEFSGHQVTLMIHSENDMGLSNGYSYVSFFVPEF